MSEGVLVVRLLEIEEVAVAAERLPLNRLAQPGGEYLVAWDGSEPVGHAHLDWRSDPPELQDVFVREPRRRRGIGSALCAAAERHVIKRGGRRIGLEMSEEDRAARALYEKLGYNQTDDPPRRIRGTIELRRGPIDVDETLVRFEKPL
jgi:[ribosomal protein S18]-alanine N-acetyltransferase